MKSWIIFNLWETQFYRLLTDVELIQVEVLVQNSLWKYPSRPFLPMKIPRQTNNAYDPDIASFKFSMISCARTKPLMKRPVQTKIRYDTDSDSFNLWPNKFMIQTLARSSSEKTQVAPISLPVIYNFQTKSSKAT